MKINLTLPALPETRTFLYSVKSIAPRFLKRYKVPGMKSNSTGMNGEISAIDLCEEPDCVVLQAYVMMYALATVCKKLLRLHRYVLIVLSHHLPGHLYDALS